MIRPALRWLSPQGRDARLCTLIFHRVLPEPDPIFPDEVDARRFDEICGWLAAWFNVLPLDEAIAAMKAGALPERSLCITFDDGYEDNHSQALPILRRHRLAATFFIATGFLDGGRMWNDGVIEAGRHAIGSSLDLSNVRGAGLGMYSMSTPAARRASIEQIIGRVKYLPLQRRLEVVAEILNRAGVKARDDLMMSSEQVLQMRRAGMQIGAHTMRHPILTTLDGEAVRREVEGSKIRLEEILGEQVRLFAYPNGKPKRDYDAQAVSVVRDLGFEGAVSTARGVGTLTTDPLQVPRFTPWDRTPWRFIARMAGLMRHGPEEAVAA